MAELDDLTIRVLRMFDEMGKETLDLHELFEAGGNDPDKRRDVFFAVERLVEQGLLEERGNDFYALTAKGRESTAKTDGDVEQAD
ncbi:MAG: hypothetical protein LC754_04710 [Acidobacteria bacterium]|nr:hypothetical protein [Acidobacteriota bacterium]